jgi:tetratricopeptide (TPR) repeat protein
MQRRHFQAEYLVLNAIDEFKTFGGHDEKIYSMCSHGEDIAVNTTKKLQRQVGNAAGAAGPKNVEQPKKAAASSSSSASQSRKVDVEELARVRIEGRRLLSSKLYRQARIYCESKLAREFPSDVTLTALLIESRLGAEHFDAAVSLAEKAIKQHATEGHLYYLLGKALSGQGNPDEAELAFRRALQLVEKNPRDFAKDFALEVSALLAESVYDSGRHNEAAQIVNELVTTPSGFTHVPLLYAYSRFAAEYDKVEEPLQALLKAVTIDQNNLRVNTLLSKLLSSERGVMELMRQVPPSGNGGTVSQAYAFLANIARDRSVFSAAKALLTVALEKRPSFASYALNLAHVYENICDMGGALTVISQFFRNNADLRIGKYGPTCAQLAAAMEEADSEAVLSVNVVTKEYVKWVYDSDGGHCEVLEVSSDDVANADVISAAPSAKEAYNDSDLDLMAIGFTAVKILYHAGKIALLPRLFKHLEPARTASLTAIHMTSIRNEHAYYSCVGQVLATRVTWRCFSGLASSQAAVETATEADPAPFAVVNAAFTDPSLQNEAAYKKPIYFCSDSHTIPAAWSILAVKGIQRMLIPKLVTGLKQWHLRKQSDFYPKAHFWNTIKTIPDRAEVR